MTIEDYPLIGKARIADLERQLEAERQAHLVCIEMRNDAEAEIERLRAALREIANGDDIVSSAYAWSALMHMKRADGQQGK